MSGQRGARTVYDGSEIAVIGMSGRFPGAGSVDELWRDLVEGREGLRRLTPEELAAAGERSDALDDPDYVPVAGTVEGIELFDAAFFGYGHREAELIDPQQRIFLECSWQALEDAGYDPETYDGLVGVYASSNLSGYMLNNLYSRRDLLASAGVLQFQMGNDKDYLATRVSFKLGLTGPSFTVQCACSSSLVAVHLARKSLLEEECDIALAGGVSLRVPQELGYRYVRDGIVSPDGHCRPFDADAAGTVFTSGAGVVVLKRLEDALADGDDVRAVVRGSAVNNDGAVKVGYTAPAVDGQAEVLIEALADGGVDPATVGYVETHGTGTALGDPIELAALKRAFGDGLEPASCALGSIKSNLGHLSMAAGVVGLIKVVRMLEERTLVPSLHFQSPNPALGIEGSPFYVNTERREWPADGPRRAGVSSFGLGGTNAHLVLEEAPVRSPAEAADEPCLVVVSARTATALDQAAGQLADHLEAHPELPLADVVYTCQVGRKGFSHRRAFVCRERDEALELLRGGDPKRVLSLHQERRDRPVVFLFPGQGAQHPGMGRGLYATRPVYRRAIERCAEILEPHLGLDLRELLSLDLDDAAGAGRLEQTALAQPALFTVSYALAKLWESLGIRPAAMIGHSVGEYVAACLAGVFSLEDGLALVAERGRLMQELPGGSMLAVPRPEAEVVPLLGDELALAAVNAPSLTVVSGPTGAVEDLARRLEADGVEPRRLHTSHAFHSPMIEPAVGPFTERLERVSLEAPRIPILSNLTGDRLAPEEATDPAYWARHARETVRFADGLRRLEEEPDWVLLEVGPGRTLASLVKRQGGAWARRVVVSSLPHVKDREEHGKDGTGDGVHLLGAVARLWLAGAPVRWQGLHGDGAADAGARARRRVPLPTYPFERRRYWIEPGTAAPSLAAGAPVVEEAGGAAGAPAGGETDAPVQDTLHDRGELTTPYVEPRTELERTLEGIWSRAFAIDGLGVHDDFFELGGHSLLATQVASAIRDALGVDLAVRDLFGAPTIADLAEWIEARRGSEGAADAPAIKPIPRDGVLPTSFDQERMWLLARLEGANPALQVPAAFTLHGTLDAGALAACFAAVARRHETLRATFATSGSADGDRLVVTVVDEPAPILGVVDLRALPDERRRAVGREVAGESLRAGLDPGTGRLARAVLVRLDGEENLLTLAMHHIVSDVRSVGVVMAEVAQLYPTLAAGGAPEQAGLPEPPIQYADYAAWQRAWLSGEALEGRLAYWRELLSGDLPSLELPTDRPRPEVASRRGGHQPVRLSPELTAAVRELSRREGVTAFMTLFAAFNVMLLRASGQEDLLVGMPVANRERPEVERLVGLFANTLVLRTDLSGDPTFREVVGRVRERMLEALAHQEVPFAKVVEAVQPDRRAGQNPLFQVMFSLVEEPLRAPEMADLALEPLEVESGVAAFDLFLTLFDVGSELRGGLAYSADLFDAPTAARLAEDLLLVLETVVAQPDARFSELPLLAPTTLAVAATFTAEPVEEVLAFWMRQLGLPSRVRFAPYDQVFQQLLDPTSLLATNRGGVNVLLVRPVDWLRVADEAGVAVDSGPEVLERARRNARELTDAVAAAAERSGVPHLLCICPATGASEGAEARAFLADLEQGIVDDLADRGGVVVIPSAKVAATYPVAEPYDRRRDELGHVPYTEAAFAALGTMVARTIHALVAPPSKVLVLDCDQTLWRGVCGEDGTDGIEIDPPRRDLQEAMIAQHDAGKLLCLCSKNVEQDVAAVFDQRSDMPLRRDHLVSWKINWRRKSENIRELADELQLGLDSFVFLDDNPVECAEVGAGCPQVTTIQVPTDDSLSRFVRHLWILDQLRVTGEDRKRTAMYRQNIDRERLRKEAPSLSEFLGTLELRVDIAPPREDQIPRTSQLTQRTNQFNVTTIRRSEADIARLGDEGLECLVCEVRDRFGEYGQVSVVIFGTGDEALEVDTFLLSCRVLGRGVEHRILARLAEIARDRGLARVDVPFRPTARNQPARDFLRAVGADFEEPGETAVGEGEESWFRMPVAEAIGAFERVIAGPAESADDDAGGEGGGARAQVESAPADRFAHHAWRSAQLAKIARHLHDAAEIARWTRPPRRSRAGTAGGDYVAPRTEVERTLADLWAEALRVERLGVEDDFFALGGHSLMATGLLARVQEVFGLELPLHRFFEMPTVARMAAEIEASARAEAGADAQPIEPVPRDGRLPLSYAQERLWVLYQLDPSSPRHNVPVAFRLRGELDLDALVGSLEALVRRHEILRATFRASGARDEGPVHVLAAQPSVDVELADLREVADDAREAAIHAAVDRESRRPFDLERGPLFRVLLVRTGEAENVLVLTFHHIVFDGWSLGVLETELGRLYRAAVGGEDPASGPGAGLPELPIQYVDFAAWQRRRLEEGGLERHLEYWRDRLAGAPALLELPADRPRPPVQSHRGGRLAFDVPEELATALADFSRRQGVTRFATLLAGFATLLHRYAGTDDLVVGTPSSNRGRAEVTGLIGLFMDLLVIRADLAGDPTFDALTARLRDVSLEAFAHGDVPFGHLVSALGVERDPAYNPLCQVLFSYFDYGDEERDWGGLALSPIQVERGTIDFDLFLTVIAGGGRLRMTLEYNLDLFEPATAERMVRHLRTLLRAAVERPETPVSLLPLMDESEARESVRAGVERKAAPAESVLPESLVERLRKAAAARGGAR